MNRNRPTAASVSQYGHDGQGLGRTEVVDGRLGLPQRLDVGLEQVGLARCLPQDRVAGAGEVSEVDHRALAPRASRVTSASPTFAPTGSRLNRVPPAEHAGHGTSAPARLPRAVVHFQAGSWPFAPRPRRKPPPRRRPPRRARRSRPGPAWSLISSWSEGRGYSNATSHSAPHPALPPGLAWANGQRQVTAAAFAVTSRRASPAAAAPPRLAPPRLAPRIRAPRIRARVRAGRPARRRAGRRRGTSAEQTAGQVPAARAGAPAWNP